MRRQMHVPPSLPIDCRLLRYVRRALGFCCLLSLLLLRFAAAEITLVPLPIFTTDPNEKQTYGALLAVIDAQEGVFRSLLVPYVTYNPLLGLAGSVHYERFFDQETKFD